MDRPILMPPGVPADRVAALKTAFHAAMIDPAFLADAKKQRLEVKEVSGEKVAQLLTAAYAMPPDVVKAANEAMGRARHRCADGVGDGRHRVVFLQIGELDPPEQSADE